MHRTLGLLLVLTLIAVTGIYVHCSTQSTPLITNPSAGTEQDSTVELASRVSDRDRSSDQLRQAITLEQAPSDSDPAATASISGWVTADGKTVRGAEVVAGGMSRQTDADGRFQFEAIPAGTTRIYVQSKALEIAFNAENLVLIHASTSRELRPGEHLDLRFAMRTISLKGRLIVSSSNQAAVGQIVLRGEAIKSKGKLLSSPLLVLPTLRDGRFEVRALPPGKYTVSAFAPNQLSRDHEIKIEQGTHVQDLVLEPMVTVSGEIHSVKDLPSTMTLSGPTVQKIKLRGKRFRCRRLIPGLYRAILHHQDGDKELIPGLMVSTQNTDQARL